MSMNQKCKTQDHMHDSVFEREVRCHGRIQKKKLKLTLPSISIPATICAARVEFPVLLGLSCLSGLTKAVFPSEKKPITEQCGG